MYCKKPEKVFITWHSTIDPVIQDDTIVGYSIGQRGQINEKEKNLK
jgi:hypothetical protein